MRLGIVAQNCNPSSIGDCSWTAKFKPKLGHLMISETLSQTKKGGVAGQGMWLSTKALYSIPSVTNIK